MPKIHQRDTIPELLLRKELCHIGPRYRLLKKGQPGVPNIMFSARRIVVFCDGNFWHGRKWNLSGKKKFSARHSYWSEKTGGNIAQDSGINRELRNQDWTVLRCWESEILETPERVVGEILSAYENANASK